MKVIVTALLLGSVLEQLQEGRVAPGTLQLRHPFKSHVAQFGLHATHSPSITLELSPEALLLVLKDFKKNPALHDWAIVGVLAFTARHFCCPGEHLMHSDILVVVSKKKVKASPGQLSAEIGSLGTQICPSKC